MKKLFITALLMIGMTSFAQEGKPMKVAEQMTSEQKNESQLKKLTAELNLDANQQQEIARLLSERSTKREELKKEMEAKRQSGVKPTEEERNNRKSVMADYDKAEKAKLQKLLTPEQFTRYEKMRQEREEKVRASREKQNNTQNEKK